MTHAGYTRNFSSYDHTKTAGKTTKAACGRRIKTELLVPQGSQSCKSCQRMIDAVCGR